MLSEKKPDRLLSWFLFGRQPLNKVVGLVSGYSEYSFVATRCMNARTVCTFTLRCVDMFIFNVPLKRFRTLTQIWRPRLRLHRFACRFVQERMEGTCEFAADSYLGKNSLLNLDRTAGLGHVYRALDTAIMAR